ncbi:MULTISPECIES: LrgB family protein [Priestia]|uniref:LrgB family protein n=2 Tax=Priestia TaxID=2800373 RepID=A0AAX6N409_PRIAR|nr:MULTISPECIES: LrgB family protein [Priestia]MDU9690476.1 LrgB family protein [Priestia aryabhattai]PVC73952.1 LrgB family protein [Priestia megaterium]TPF18706.1 LrgB family protein [Priestia megaterium]TPF22815.1 LrgB family protein [Priestia megaterium]SUV05178.1 putative murein hydrolase export regulator [Priestia megaterium]
MQEFFIAVFIIVATVALYLVMAKVYVRFSYPILIPVLTTTIFVILLLLAFHISYDEYMIGGKWINSLLGPAVVALAYPLYKQREMLVKYSVPIIGGVFVGLFAGMISGLVFAEVFGVDRSLILSIIPKSITTPVAIQIATGLGGVPSMTVVFVMIAGFSGVILGPLLLKWIRIKSSLGKGIALGSASHALGTSKAFEYGELTVSMSSVSMTLSAVLGSVFGPIVVWLFQV